MKRTLLLNLNEDYSNPFIYDPNKRLIEYSIILKALYNAGFNIRCENLTLSNPEQYMKYCIYLNKISSIVNKEFISFDTNSDISIIEKEESVYIITMTGE